MTHVAIVGAGLIGRSWAIAFARGGHLVKMYDPAEGVAARSFDLMPDMLAELSSSDLLRGQTPTAVLARISIAPTLEACVTGAAYVQESAFENRDIKAQLFSELDACAGDDTILASSTSVILPSLFTGHIARKSQCLVAHPLNPPHLIPAIEIVPAPWTAPDITARAKALHESIGQKPIVMAKEIDGFLMNRLQGALIEECMRLLDGGYVTAEEIDISIKHGLAMRWAFIGPLETMDLNAPGGIHDYIKRFDQGFQKIREQALWRPDWQGHLLEQLTGERTKVLPRNQIQDRQNWRDRMLMKLAVLKKAVAE